MKAAKKSKKAKDADSEYTEPAPKPAKPCIAQWDEVETAVSRPGPSQP